MKKQDSRKPNRRSGQAIIFLMVVMVIGLLVVLWNYDLHNIVSTKVRIDNAGDAAALSAARWQGISLNMVGELNLIQAAHVCESLLNPDDTNDVARVQAEVEEIANLRARIALNGPLMGFVAAQSAAFMNLSAKDEGNREDDFSSWMQERALAFQTCGDLYEGTVQESYDGGFLEYGNLLSSIANNKMVVKSGNTEFYRYYGASHILIDPGFYDAVAAMNWCYFKAGTPRALIDGYESIGDWPPLPEMAIRSSVNSEYFGLDLSAHHLRLGSFVRGIQSGISNYYDHLSFDDISLDEQAERYFEQEMNDNYSQNDALLPYVFSIRFPWHIYDMNKWLNVKWPTPDEFPFEEGTQVPDEYNYRGADAAVDCYISAVSITPNMKIDSDMIFWQAAAKPFGYIEDPDDPGLKRPPVYFGAVLPAFHKVRLIHNNISSRTGGSRPNSAEHFYKHLPLYMEGGLPAIEDLDCFYCEMLKRWEDPGFRQEGSDWLEENQQGIDDGIVCPPIDLYPGRGGGGGGGSTMGRG